MSDQHKKESGKRGTRYLQMLGMGVNLFNEGFIEGSACKQFKDKVKTVLVKSRARFFFFHCRPYKNTWNKIPSKRDRKKQSIYACTCTVYVHTVPQVNSTKKVNVPVEASDQTTFYHIFFMSEYLKYSKKNNVNYAIIYSFRVISK